MSKIDFSSLIPTISSLFTVPFSLIIILSGIKPNYYGINSLKVFLFYEPKDKLTSSNVVKIVDIILAILIAFILIASRLEFFAFFLFMFSVYSIMLLFFNSLLFISSNNMVKNRTALFIQNTMSDSNSKEIEWKSLISEMQSYFEENDFKSWSSLMINFQIYNKLIDQLIDEIKISNNLNRLFYLLGSKTILIKLFYESYKNEDGYFYKVKETIEQNIKFIKTFSKEADNDCELKKLHRLLKDANDCIIKLPQIKNNAEIKKLLKSLKYTLHQK